MTAVLLAYADLARAQRFFVDALGFVEEWTAHDDDGALTRAHVRLGDTLLMLDRPGAHGVKSPHEVDGVTHLLVVTVGDVDAHHARAAAAGAEILVRPTDRPWGRDYELRDGEGYVFSFFS
jgi:uncharacterized glyoxalase superfamily protein PhnB